MMYYNEIQNLSGLIAFCLWFPPAFTALFYSKMSVLGNSAVRSLWVEGSSSSQLLKIETLKCKVISLVIDADMKGCV